MIQPSVSVILPTYNRAFCLPRAIYSVLNQSYDDLELIVVDDGSTDETGHILAGIADTRLRVIRQSVNGGPCVARNTGIQASAGRYIAFQDSDSEWLPGKLIKQVTLLEAAAARAVSAVACYSRFGVVRGRRRMVQPSDAAECLSGRIYRRLLYGNTMDTPTMLVRRETFDALGRFDEGMSNLEDWDLALRIGMHGAVVFVDEVTILSYVTPGGVNRRLYPESKVTILRKHFDAYRNLPEAMAPLAWSIGTDYARRGERDNAVRYMRLSLDLAPSRGRRLTLAAVASGINPYPMEHFARSLWHLRGMKVHDGISHETKGIAPR